MTKAPPGGGPWPLLVKLFLAQRATLPPAAVEWRLSAAQCQVLRLIEPDRPLPMGQLAERLPLNSVPSSMMVFLSVRPLVFLSAMV